MYSPNQADLAQAQQVIDIGVRLAEEINLADIPDLAVSLVHGEGAEQILAEATATAIFIKSFTENDEQMAYEALAETLEVAIKGEELRDAPEAEDVDITPFVEEIKSPGSGSACGEE